MVVAWRHLLVDRETFACEYNENSRYLVLGLPMDWTTTYVPGTRFAPQRIRHASCNIELYSITTRRVLEGKGYVDLGDVFLPNGDIMASVKNIEQVVRGILDEYPDRKYFFIGGEHLVTLPLIRALSKEIESIIVFDAHGDLRDEYLGVKYSHATVMRRIIEETKLPIYFIGTRALSEEEHAYIEANNIVVVDPLEINRVDEVVKEAVADKKVYISIDMDAIDPSYAPGVSNPEPLGLTPLQLLEITEKIVEYSRSIVGVDIVEVNPLRDVNDVTSILAAKILVEITGLLDRFD